MMKKSAITFIVFLMSSYSLTAQEVQPTISRVPVVANYLDVLEISETHHYGVYEPADSPEAWGSIYHLSPGPRAGVLITDPRMNSVYLVVPGEGVVQTFGGGVGDGPGEFRYATTSAWNGLNEILIADRSQLRTTVFNLDGEYQRSFQIHEAFRITISSGEILWVTGNSFAMPDRIRRYDTSSGEYLGEVGGRYQDEPWGNAPIFGNVVSSPARIFAQNSYPYEIVEYSPDGQVESIFGRQARWLDPPEEDENGVLSQRGGSIRGIGCLPDGTVIVFLWKRIDNEEFTIEGYFDLFTASGAWLTTIPANDLRENTMAARFTVASDGALWIYWAGDYPTVTRYHLQIKD